jgi:hypothetical protein
MSWRSALLRFALLGLAASPFIVREGRARGGPPADDGVPSGTIAFFSGGICPAGWTPATEVQGRLVVGAPGEGTVGVQVGDPLGDREDRAHQHAYTGSVQPAFKPIAAADGSNQSGAQAQDYPVAGTTQAQVSGLGFVQVQACAKP